MEFSITALDGDSVKVDAENWMMAMGKALAFFDIDIRRIGRLTCSSAKDGSVLVEDGQRSWMVRQHGSDIQVRVTPRSSRDTWKPAAVAPSIAPGADLGPNRPAVVMPETSLKREEPKSLGEQLFELTTEIDQLSIGQACDRALDAILSFVRADGAAILRGTLNDPALEAVAVRGPRAGAYAGRKIGFGEGLVGMAFDMRGTLVVHDVSADTPHVDLASGPVLSVLCCPMLDDEGGANGVVQLVNPADRPFTQQNVDVVEVVARTLAGALVGR